MDRPYNRWRWELWVVVAILLAAAALRLIDLSDVPPGLRYDELLNYRMAQRVLTGDTPLYFTESWGHEPLFHYAQAGALALVGHSDWSLRLPAVVFGLLSVLTSWLVARRLFGTRVALLTAGGLALSFWSVFYSRDGLRGITVVPLTCLMVYFLWQGFRLGKLSAYLSAGIFLGSTFYTYMAARAFPALPAAFALYLLLLHRRRFKKTWWGLLLAVIVGLLLAAPLLYRVYGPSGAEQRVQQLAGAWQALQAGDPQPVLNLALRAAGMFVWQGQEDWLYNVAGRPIFDPLSALPFLLGMGLCLWRWKQPQAALLLVWLVVGLAPTLIAEPPASISHAIAAQPPTYMILALGLEALWRTLEKRWRYTGAALVSLILIAHGMLGAYAYFFTWANAPQVQQLHQSGVTTIARQLDAAEAPGAVAVGAPYVNAWHPWNVVSFELALRRDDVSVRWFNPAGGWVWPAGDGSTTYYFPQAPLGPQSFHPLLEDLFHADAAPVPTTHQRVTAFRVDSPAALEARLTALPTPALAWPPEMTPQPAPQTPLDFGDRFALLGIELLTPSVQPGGDVQFLTYWQTLTTNPAPVVAFAHLTSNGQDLWGQQDWLDVWADGLQPGDRFVQIHSLPVDSQTPPGTYHLALGLYNPQTLDRIPVVDGVDRVWAASVEVTAAKE